jgi:hypothetical protein
MGIKGELKVFKNLLEAYYNVHVYNGVMYNGCIKVICNTYLHILKKSTIHKTMYVCYTYIKFLLKIFIYKIYNVHITCVSKDFDVMLPINVY